MHTYGNDQNPALALAHSQHRSDFIDGQDVGIS